MTLIPNDRVEQSFDTFISEITDLKVNAIEESTKPHIVPSRNNRGYGRTIQPSPLTEPFESLKQKLLNFIDTLTFSNREDVIHDIKSMFSPPDISVLNRLLGMLKGLKDGYSVGSVQLLSELTKTANDIITLNIFVSSKMKEFAVERQVLSALIPKILQGKIRFHAWVFERDSVATELPSREIWLEKLEASVLYIGLFGAAYGEWTIDEFNRAKQIGLSKLIFIKDVQQEHREQRLIDFINEISNVTTGLTPQYFSTIQDLEKRVTAAITNWIWERLSNKSRHKYREVLKNCKEEYLAWFDNNQRLPDDQKNQVEHTNIIRKTVQICEDVEDVLDDEGKMCLNVNANSVDWDSCYSKYKNNLTYIAKKRLVPYFVTGHSASEGPADKAGAEQMGVYYQRNLDAMDAAINRLKELL